MQPDTNSRARVDEYQNKAEDDIERWWKQYCKKGKFSLRLAYHIAKEMLDDVMYIAAIVRKESVFRNLTKRSDRWSYATCQLHMARISALWNMVATDHWSDIEDLMLRHGFTRRVVSFGNGAGKGGLKRL